MKNLKIGEKLTRVPLIQGGMGVGVSLGRLAALLPAKAGSESYPLPRSVIATPILTGIRRRPICVPSRAR